MNKKFMNYQVLARKWRPQKFSDVIGQQHIITALINSFSLKKIHHAYIFIGMRGVGKTTIARLLSKGLNCEKDIVSDICGKCKNCKDIELGCFADLIEIDAASRTKVEETREFLDNIQYVPLRGRFTVYLIDEVHMLSKHSFNALLKVLEEPPMHVKFILVTTEYKKIPETVLSRCLQFYLKPLNITQITEKLKYIFNAENVVINTLALESLAYASKGSMRDALNLSEQAIVLSNNHEITSDIINNMFGIINTQYPLCLIEHLIDGNINDILYHIDNYEILGINWDYFLIEMLTILKKIAVHQALSNSSFMSQEKNNSMYDVNQRMHKISKRVTPEKIQLYYQIILLGRQELPYAPSFRIGIEITMLRALTSKPDMHSAIIQNNNESFFNNINGFLNINFLKNSNINNVTDTVTTKNLHQTPQKNSSLNLNINNQQYGVDYLTSNVESLISPNITSDVTKKLLKARLTLSKYKEFRKLHNIQKIPNSIKISQKETIKNILKRFSDSNVNITKNAITHTNVINENDSKNLEINYQKNNIKKIYKKPRQNTIPVFIKKILQQAIKHDPWMLQIYRLSLPKLAKKLAMNSWKENISENKICLHVRAEHFYLNSIELRNIIQQSFSKYMGKSIILYIHKDTGTKMNTPIEHIHILYKKKILEIKEEFSSHPHIKMIQNFFDVEFNENDIQLL